MLLAKIASRIEKIIDQFRRPNRSPNPVIHPYLGYSTPQTIVIRGRVLNRRPPPVRRAAPSRLHNARDMATYFMTHEIPDVLVSCCGVDSRTDEEGYFRLNLPRSTFPDGRVTLSLPDFNVSTDAEVKITPNDAEWGVISDIDDTIMQTGAWRLYKNLWTTMTGNAASRHVFPDSAALIKRLHDGKNPVFYVSSSPWNLHMFLNHVFENSKVVNGPKFLRDFGISETQFITGTHGSHKSDAIDEILEANPQLDFYLIGDTGQHDAQVYLGAIKKHPGRVKQVILRTAGPLDEADRLAAEAITETGTDFYVGEDFSDFIAQHLAARAADD